MRITEYGSIKGSTPVRRKTGTQGASGVFAELLSIGGADDAAPAASLEELSPTQPLDTVLALQEISEEETRKKRAMQHGKNLLDELEKLRTQLLLGEIPISTLQNLQHRLTTQKQNIADPHLLSIIDDIELRAAVELAKLEMAAERQRLLE